MPKEDYYHEMNRRVERLLRTLDVTVAYFDQYPEVVAGYTVAQGNLLHWVFVKKSMRGLGIARELVHGRGFTTYTTYTPFRVRFLHYNPFLRVL